MSSLKKKNIAVLMGGWNGERDVSLSSAKGVIAALKDKGYTVNPIELTRDMLDLTTRLTPNPDVVFMNALHGRWVEDGCLQGLLEMMKIPYTNSGPVASMLAMDKILARKFFQEAGLPVAPGYSIDRKTFESLQIYPYPFVLKPVGEGSSLGVQIFHGQNDLPKARDVWTYGDRVLLETYIPGREIQVGILGDRALGAIEICPKEGFYDYRAKYTDGYAHHLMPAPLPEDVYSQALDLGMKAHKVLGCEGVSRVDLRYDDTTGNPGKFYILEVNSQPGMTPLSLVPEIAQHAGLSFGDLVEWMVENPRCPN